jgi:hypothetical protein
MDKYNKLKGKHHRLTELAADQQRRIAELEEKLKEISTILQLGLDITYKRE